MVVSVLATTSVLAPMDLVAQIVKIKLAQFTVKMVGFARCQTTNVNVVTDTTELDATKSKIN